MNWLDAWDKPRSLWPWPHKGCIGRYPSPPAPEKRLPFFIVLLFGGHGARAKFQRMTYHILSTRSTLWPNSPQWLPKWTSRWNIGQRKSMQMQKHYLDTTPARCRSGETLGFCWCDNLRARRENTSCQPRRKKHRQTREHAIGDLLFPFPGAQLQSAHGRKGEIKEQKTNTRRAQTNWVMGQSWTLAEFSCN